jgi:hypothetical protein
LEFFARLVENDVDSLHALVENAFRGPLTVEDQAALKAADEKHHQRQNHDQVRCQFQV